METFEACAICGCVEHIASHRYVREGRDVIAVYDGERCVLCGTRWTPVVLCETCEQGEDDCECQEAVASGA